MKATVSRSKITVSADGRGVVAHAGTRLLADVADVTGLTAAVSEALAPSRQRQGGHDPGRVAVDMAVLLADGGEAIADLAVLRDQVALFGPVASAPTAWRVLAGIDADALTRLRPPALKRGNSPGRRPLNAARSSLARPRPGGRSPGSCSMWTQRS